MVMQTVDSRALELVRGLSNTVDVEAGTDELAHAEGLAQWLQSVGLIDDATAVMDSDLATARALRSALRAALVAHHDDADDPEALRRLDELAAELPLRASFSPGTEPTLEAAGGGAKAALATIVAAMVEVARDGAWRRLKICGADDCQWAFYDESKNQSRRWCGAGCRNVAKTRAYRARQRGTQASG